MQSTNEAPDATTTALQPDRLITNAQVRELTSLSRSSLWRLESAGKFPPRRALEASRRVWLLSDVLTWMHGLPEVPLTRDNKNPSPIGDN